MAPAPKEYADRISGLFRSTWDTCGIAYDHFIRTTDAYHKEYVQSVLQKIYDAGDIYFGEYSGFYCYGCERFYTEKELVDGKCPDHQTAPDYISEKNYFFRMSKYQQQLIEAIQSKPDLIRPERYRTEVLAFLREPLEDLCISRPTSRLQWGIPMPFDDNYVTYVWFDALLNYVSALQHRGADSLSSFWPKAQHLIAKDILKPHAIYWPTMLMAAGLPLYDHLNVHGYWVMDSGKMSKSLGNVIRPLEMKARFGMDAFRYFLLREMAFGQDAKFSEEALITRINADLANNLGNLVSRVLAMQQKYFAGVVQPFSSEWAAEDVELRGKFTQAEYGPEQLRSGATIPSRLGVRLVGARSCESLHRPDCAVHDDQRSGKASSRRRSVASFARSGANSVAFARAVHAGHGARVERAAGIERRCFESTLGSGIRCRS